MRPLDVFGDAHMDVSSKGVHPLYSGPLYATKPLLSQRLRLMVTLVRKQELGGGVGASGISWAMRPASA